MPRDPGPEEWPRGSVTPRGTAPDRSDDAILDEVADRIARSGVDATEVDVRVLAGVVRLAGTVEHREDRRMLELLAADVPGVVEVEAPLRVRRPH